MAVKVLKECNPNRHGRVRLLEEQVSSGTYWMVQYPGVDEQEEDEFDTLGQAEGFYDAIVKRLSETRNWEAQAAYDDQHGTDNGYAPWQFNREY